MSTAWDVKPRRRVCIATASVLWWAGGAFVVMWALMFCMPKHANSQGD
ncbi:hypothetical protein AB0I94_39155 [Streptomyces sp. NPDC050147]